MHASNPVNRHHPLPRVSDFRRRLHAAGDAGHSMAGTTRLSALDRSLLQDLQRFETQARAQGGLEMLEVVAAAVRHGRMLTLMLQHDEHVLPLTVMPMERRAHAPLAPESWGQLRWSALKVLQVEPASTLARPAEQTVPLSNVLWALALVGARSELLPEIAGPAAYRVMPFADVAALDLSGSMGLAVDRLRRQTTPLREIAGWPGFNRERATRLLNGFYLQAGLLVTRAHPAAAA